MEIGLCTTVKKPFWYIPAMMPSISGLTTTEGNTARRKTSPGKQVLQACHCRCRRRARPRRERDEVRGVRLFLLLDACSAERRTRSNVAAAASCTAKRLSFSSAQRRARSNQRRCSCLVHQTLPLLLFHLLLLLLPPGLQRRGREEAEGGGVHNITCRPCQNGQAEGRQAAVAPLRPWVNETAGRTPSGGCFGPRRAESRRAECVS